MKTNDTNKIVDISFLKEKKKVVYKSHPITLSQNQYNFIYNLLPKVKRTRPIIHCRKLIIEALFYVLKTGCQWRLLPNNFPPFRIVHRFFRKLCVLGTWDKITKVLCFGDLFYKQNSLSFPDALIIIDSKSIRTSCYYNGSNRGYDGHKKIDGIKLCPVIDKAARLWSIQMFSANTNECKAFQVGLERAIVPKLTPTPIVGIGDRFFDSQPFKDHCLSVLNLYFVTLAKGKSCKGETQEEADAKKFEQKKISDMISPIRYIIEQTFAHLEQSRRLVMVYERKSSSYLGMVNLRFIQMWLNRLMPH